ncbi:HAMP domain-containing histidine kinase [Aquimarina sp. MMG015]|uniref:sensor histidine kinase n=1 Tax=unclassified Aquimarina TaxID=2627091 RepID=UPI000E4D2F36|nr:MULTISPECIES: HAMP domain-containing sensor histidine kinase [unclassified Aquimarina]AXT57998.1 sensor histidine kinase [Aquimarina sp. AD1]MBQ4803101.1 HAMP domain-containing histidine kinase [Aquimarina sp. MMG015]RKN33140.1 sensor histidine kinase [Aquimarina sp. AD1]
MQKNSYRSILYFIAFVILVTLSIQVYWNLKNYEASKQQLINEVQISLDNAVDQYYTELAEKNTIGFSSDSSNIGSFLKKSSFSNLLKKIDSGTVDFKSYTFSEGLDHSDIKIYRGLSVDSIDRMDQHPNFCIDSSKIIEFPDGLEEIENGDSRKKAFEQLTSKIIISINEDSLQLEVLDTIINNQLKRKQLTISYGITFQDQTGTSFLFNENVINQSDLKTKTKSYYLPRGSSLELSFMNTTRTILKKNLFGIALSFLLVSAVIGCLLYLLNIINRQKQLAELKNDLISNITHEFKTPIATISVALEGIQNFNRENDPEKTKKYIDMSSNQLGKLNTMVEKILETATLDSEELELNLEEVNLVDLTQTITNRHQTNTTEKNISFHHTHENIWKKVDAFHFENAINNIIDNAIKYGGNNIDIYLKNTHPNITLEIKDNGTSLIRSQKDKIFEKFYRVPKGNTHDVKGFGIGLFYTKTIIEKHEGTIELLLDQDQTNFKITLPNG